MGMQLTSLSMGSAVAAAIPQEKKVPLPGEPRTTEQIDDPMPDKGKSGSQNLQQTTTNLEHIGLAFNRRLKFEIDQESGEVLVKVIDNETDKVIKVLPPEELQRLHSRIRETMGFLFDRMV